MTNEERLVRTMSWGSALARAQNRVLVSIAVALYLSSPHHLFRTLAAAGGVLFFAGFLQILLGLRCGYLRNRVRL